MTREELAGAITRVLEAMKAHDPAAARLAPGARYTENGQELIPGDGLWGTLDTLGTYRHDFLDTVSGQAATITTIAEGAVRSILVLRVKLDAGGIAEVEAIAARPDVMTRQAPFADGPNQLDLSGGPAPEWFAPIPEGERLPREELRRVANMYFSGIEKNDGKGAYPFADGCIRIENGFRTTEVPGIALEEEPADRDTPYQPDFRAMSAKAQLETGFFRFVDRIRDRRFPVIDEELGVVFSFAFFDHSGTVRDYELASGRTVTTGLTRPFSWEIGEAFRIEKRLFTRIEAVMTGCPYGMRPNWPLEEGDIA
ncbi:hypothetical protein SZ64_15845 [Erythrobacter sp. SG61-1L]|uniref:hypothetical protein n=1 Tax=Erythrobacter sp. SG61-1L TaxID=1603897 RepID=UPI0006C8EA75|nr:hypothetical protein [Erythrobacter sp. SG61-1L]KPL69449.1 hypothetical protein SZ64_15845 [Erythrobacter sp. SG61-1L]